MSLSPEAAPIAGKLIARMQRQVRGKVARLKNLVADHDAAQELRESAATGGLHGDLHPAHAAYIFVQNRVSLIGEQLTALREMDPLESVISRAEDEYMPSGPPMSPLTMSYFTCWSFFDACVEPGNETIGTVILELGAALGMPVEVLRLIGVMQRSRMGIYVHEGAEGDVVSLREVVGDALCRAIVPSGYLGHRGELWYVRVLPPPLPGGGEHVVFTTPYLLLDPGPGEWQAYLRRALSDVPGQSRLEAYEHHMKYGPTRAYWNEFVFEAYVNYRAEVIILTGLPDVPESRPHSKVNW